MNQFNSSRSPGLLDDLGRESMGHGKHLHRGMISQAHRCPGQSFKQLLKAEKHREKGQRQISAALSEGSADADGARRQKNGSGRVADCSRKAHPDFLPAPVGSGSMLTPFRNSIKSQLVDKHRPGHVPPQDIDSVYTTALSR